MKKVLIVSNINAGRKKAIKYKKKVIDFVLKYTKNFKFIDINEYNSADAEQFDTIITIGGDGTVSQVIPDIINTDKVLGVIPSGTANLLAANLGIDFNIDNALKVISEENIKKIDTIKINDKYCVLRFGIGYDANIICKTPQKLKNRFGYFAYIIAGIIFALRLKLKKYNIIIDGTEYKKDASCIIISNASNMYKDIVSLSKSSYLNDNEADIFILKTTNPILFFIEFIKIIFKIYTNSEIAEYKKAKSINIKNSWQLCHIDGEKKYIKEDININIIPDSVNIYSLK